jgi:hypothetical protein
MFTPTKFRAKAAEYTELVKAAKTPDDAREFQELEKSFTALADNEQWLSDNHDQTIHAPQHDTAEVATSALGAEQAGGPQVTTSFPEHKSAFHQEVRGRFRLVPHFFVTTPDAPEVIEKLWTFALAAYLDNPIPTLFKERLFVFLSRFCPVRYCIIRHCGFLVGYGQAAGDPDAPVQTVEQVITLLKVPPPWRREIGPVYKKLEALNQPTEWPSHDSEIEDAMFAACAVIFVQPAKSERARSALQRALGTKRLEYLLALLAFIRTAHFWTVVHPGLQIEDDVRELMSENKELAVLLLQDPDAVGS